MDNQPGLSQLSYRTGAHGDFLARMIELLADPAHPAMQDLSTREPDDLTLGLLDACASMGDVLTFYQERIANENYLGTAVERLSIRELSSLVNYRFSPGKAADVYVAFELDTAVGSPREVPLTEGIKVESVPGPDELLEPFETIEAFVARPEWNEIRPRMARPVSIEEVAGNGWAYVVGTGLSIAVGDRLMVSIEGHDEPSLKVVSAVSEDPVNNTTTVEFGSPPTVPAWEPEFSNQVWHSPVMTTTSAPLQLNTEWIENNVQGAVWNQADLVAQGAVWGYETQLLVQTMEAIAFPLLWPDQSVPIVDGLSVFRTTAAIFGHDANPIAQGPPPASEVVAHSDQPDDVAKELRGSLLPLAAEHTGIPDGSVVALESKGALPAAFYRVNGVVTESINRYQRSARVSQLDLALPIAHDLDNRETRSTTVHAEPEPLVLADMPVTDDVGGDSIVLERAHLHLAIGQAVAVSGERIDLHGVTATEVRTIKELLLAGGVTVVAFEVPLEFTYKRETVRIRANLVRATHGERVERVLGSGNATHPFQTFTLPDLPLTYVAANTPTNVASTLEVRVDGVLWAERDELGTAGPDERVYMARTRENGTTRLTFGDGVTGARLPTGTENVTASYRVGLGRGGLVRADQITLIATKPLGVKGVTNPSPSSDAAPGTTLAEARVAAPNQVRTLGRVVSLRDYADFARNVAGITKAHASWVWVGEKKDVVVSIAGTDGATFTIGHRKLRDLETAYRAASDQTARARVVSYRDAAFVLALNVVVDGSYEDEVVAADIDAALRERFSFAEAVLGGPVFRSDVISCVQQRPSVLGVDIDVFDRAIASPAANPSRLVAALPARGQRTGPNPELVGAELLRLDDRPVTIAIEVAP